MFATRTLGFRSSTAVNGTDITHNWKEKTSSKFRLHSPSAAVVNGSPVCTAAGVVKINSTL